MPNMESLNRGDFQGKTLYKSPDCFNGSNVGFIIARVRVVVDYCALKAHSFDKNVIEAKIENLFLVVRFLLMQQMSLTLKFDTSYFGEDEKPMINKFFLIFLFFVFINVKK